MFPETFVRRNLHAWSKPGDLVLDPFCGRGTTILESLLNGRRGIGCDTNPVAYCISRAKATSPAFADVITRLAALRSKFKTFTATAPECDDEFFTLCFHESTLRQLLFLRSQLKWRSDDIDCFIAALALGCLHGESHRTEWCLSNRMPRTISTKPAYSIRWWSKNRCLPPKRDAFAILGSLARYRYESPAPSIKGRVVEGDARRAASLLRPYRGRVKLVVTSPPYLDITNYHEDQWLRLWLLGGPGRPDTRQAADDRHRNAERYWEFLGEAWTGIVPLFHDTCQIVVRIGGTRLSETDLRSGLIQSLNSAGRRFKLVEAGRTEVTNGQKRVFVTGKPGSTVEHDFRFTIRH